VRLGRTGQYCGLVWPCPISSQPGRSLIANSSPQKALPSRPKPRGHRRRSGPASDRGWFGASALLRLLGTYARLGHHLCRLEFGDDRYTGNGLLDHIDDDGFDCGGACCGADQRRGAYPAPISQTDCLSGLRPHSCIKVVLGAYFERRIQVANA
jgi:hypothetical protein